MYSSKTLIQTVRMRRLICVFAGCTCKKTCTCNKTHCANAQADLSLRWSNIHNVFFVSKGNRLDFYFNSLQQVLVSCGGRRMSPVLVSLKMEFCSCII